jgi:lysozyme
MDLSIAIELCKEFEGFRSKPYLCPAGVPTIGYGSTRYLDGRLVTLQDPPIDRRVAEVMLKESLRTEYLPGVLRACPGLIAHPAKLNAIVDFTYNLGVGRLQSSTLRRRINEGDWEGAKEQLMRWTRGGGRVLSGLVRRRTAECALL